MHSQAPRIRTFGLLLLLTIAIIAARLFQLQIIQGKKYAAMAKGNRLHLLLEKPARGIIFDRHGHILVSNRIRYDLAIVPRMTGSSKSIAEVAAMLHIPQKEVALRLSADRATPLAPVVIKKGLTAEEITLVMERKDRLRGILIEKIPYRFYVYEGLASHLLGYVGEIDREKLDKYRHLGYRMGDVIGKTGVEGAFDTILHGLHGGSQVDYGSAGTSSRVLASMEAVRGGSLLLSLDRDTQAVAEEALAGRPGAVVAVDVRNGEILAMASSPGYDPNIFVDSLTRNEWRNLSSHPYHPLQNRASHSAWPPGSTFKMITLSAALQERAVLAGECFYCSGSYKLPGRRFRCWDLSGHGSVGLVEGMAQSCDIVFYELGRRLGERSLHHYAKAFGLGEKSGLPLSGETAGKIPSADWKEERFKQKWYAGDTLNMSIGQGFVQASPLQMALATAAVATGKLYKPLLVKAVISPGGAIVRKYEPVLRRSLPLRQDVLAIVRRGMLAAIKDPKGTGKLAAVEGVEVAGKTGTAEDPPRRPHAWFVGYAPYAAPRVAVCVFLEQGGHGGATAAPIARRVLEKALFTIGTPLSP
ncbi:MAG: penicillin-binding protein 2 [bacterium]|jgi:penicillin-binding protein 2|nr:penicillin-binding protein 2 [bacterium]